MTQGPRRAPSPAPIAVLAGLAGGMLMAARWFRPRLARALAEQAGLRADLHAATAAQAELAALRAQVSGLKHDVRGILSPALLVSDRLLSHEDAQVRRAGDVVVRTVERAAARLSEARLDGDAVGHAGS